MILSAHVDDLKGGARRSDAENFLQFLESKFGKCKAEYVKFTHTGVEHEQRPEGILCHQWSYIDTLKPLELSGLKGNVEDSSLVDQKIQEAFSSLLGGVAWTMLTRAESAVYVQALQRHGSAPRYVDCRRLNVVVRYMKRHKVGLWYKKFNGKVRMLGFTDSAFKTQEEEGSGLALRGLAVLIGPEITSGDTATIPGVETVAHLVDWVSRKLKRVVRSTFAAELNALIDAIETLLLLQLIYHQIYCGTTESADELLVKMEDGGLYPPIDLMIDARSVLDAIAAAEVCTPAEASLRLHLIAVRDRLSRGLLRSISWTDTRDMIADALTKGGIDRTMIMQAMQGRLAMKYIVRTHWGKRGKYDPTKADRNNPFAHWRRIILDFLNVHAPERVEELESMLEAFRGEESELHRLLKETYGHVWVGETRNMPEEMCRVCGKVGHWGNECPHNVTGMQTGMYTITTNASTGTRKTVTLTPRTETVNYKRPRPPSAELLPKIAIPKAMPRVPSRELLPRLGTNSAAVVTASEPTKRSELPKVSQMSVAHSGSVPDSNRCGVYFRGAKKVPRVPTFEDRGREKAPCAGSSAQGLLPVKQEGHDCTNQVGEVGEVGVAVATAAGTDAIVKEEYPVDVQQGEADWQVD